MSEIPVASNPTAQYVVDHGAVLNHNNVEGYYNYYMASESGVRTFLVETDEFNTLTHVTNFPPGLVFVSQVPATIYSATDTGLRLYSYQLISTDSYAPKLYYTWIEHVDNHTFQESESYPDVLDGCARYGFNYRFPIAYDEVNVILSGSDSAIANAAVAVSCAFPKGYYMMNPESDISVISGGEAVPFTWDAADSRITFTMPEGAVTVAVAGSPIPTYPITYRPTNVTLDGPATAAVGDTVNVDCTFPEGYGIKTTDSITVTCNRVPVPFSWDSENQRVTFTMPDPTA